MALGQSGVTLLCMIPLLRQKLLKSCELNGAPLSDLIRFEIPNVAKISLSTGNASAVDVEFKALIIGYLEKQSSSTSIYLPYTGPS